MTLPERDRLDNLESASTWFGDRFGVALPLGLRERADAMSWAGFVASYGRNVGPLRLGHWQCADDARGAARRRHVGARPGSRPVPRTAAARRGRGPAP